MIAWRLVKARYVDEPLSTAGAARDGGRWNPIGVPLVYCSLALSLAALEVLVHVTAGMRTVHYHAVQIEAPRDSVDTLEYDALPPTWRDVPCDPNTQAIGRAWAESGHSLLFRVPSVVVPQEWNMLMNPRHPAFAKVRVVATFPFAFDPRLLRKR